MTKSKYYTSGSTLMRCNQNGYVTSLEKNGDWISVPKDYFDAINKVEVKKHKFHVLVNQFYATKVKSEWMFNGCRFRKLPNFDVEGNCYDSVGFLICSINSHDNLLIYHQNGLFRIDFTKEGKAYIINIKTNPSLGRLSASGKWTEIKNLAPVWNMDLKEVVVID